MKIEDFPDYNNICNQLNNKDILKERATSLILDKLYDQIEVKYFRNQDIRHYFNELNNIDHTLYCYINAKFPEILNEIYIDIIIMLYRKGYKITIRADNIKDDTHKIIIKENNLIDTKTLQCFNIKNYKYPYIEIIL